MCYYAYLELDDSLWLRKLKNTYSFMKENFRILIRDRQSVNCVHPIGVRCPFIGSSVWIEFFNALDKEYPNETFYTLNKSAIEETIEYLWKYYYGSGDLKLSIESFGEVNRKLINKFGVDIEFIDRGTFEDFLKELSSKSKVVLKNQHIQNKEI